MILAFGSAKGSPGVSTLVAALAAVWPAGRQVVVADVDPAGGDLGPRLDLAASPGLITLAASGRRELTASTLEDHLQELPESDVRVLVGPVAAEQARAALASTGGRLTEALTGLRDSDVLVDLGRLDPGSPALELARVADLVVLVTRPVVTEVHHLATRVASLDLPGQVGLVVVGDRPYGPIDVADSVGIVGPLASVAVDPRGAAALAAGWDPSSRVLRKSELLRSARGVASLLLGESVVEVAS